MVLTPKFTTINEVIHGLDGCEQYGARFIEKSGEIPYFTYHELFSRVRSVAGTLQRLGLKKQDRVAIILPTSIHFLSTFLGIQLAGGIPAALYPPVRLGRLTEYFIRTQRMLTKIGARFLITDSRVRKLLGPAVESVPVLEKVMDADKLLGNDPWSPVEVNPESPAFLQFSSGTTVEPKAVCISHINLLHNLEMIAHFFRMLSDQEAKAAQGGVCWLPLYHDMGLVGCSYIGLYYPGTVTYIGPEQFIARPRIWLQTLSRYKGVISPAPNFAYGLCLSKIKDEDMKGVDLSSWEIALNGAEPIDTEMMNRFCDRFARWGFRKEAMTPVYGLAEAGLAVSFSDFRTLPAVDEFDRDVLSEEGRAVPGKGRSLPSLGKPMIGLAVEIWDEDGTPLQDGHVGKIMVRGPSITRGYFNDPDITASTIRDGWLDTGDLGFFHDGNLYVAGRIKDLIIVRGRNYSPQEIEELLTGVDGMRTGCAVAVSQMVEDEGEQLIVLAERDARSQVSNEELISQIEERIVTGISLTPYHVEILAPGTLPRTSSGKMRRADALRMFQTGELLPPERMSTLKVFKEIGKSQIAWGRFWVKRKLQG